MNQSRALARLVVAAFAALTLAGAAFAQSAAPAKAGAAKPVPASAKTVAADSSACYACHAPIREFHAEGKPDLLEMVLVNL